MDIIPDASVSYKPTSRYNTFLHKWIVNKVINNSSSWQNVSVYCCIYSHATGLYAEPARSSPNLHIFSSTITFILSSLYLSSNFVPYSFPDKTVVWFPHSPHIWFMMHLSHLTLFNSPNNMKWRTQIIKCIIISSNHTISSTIWLQTS